MKMTIHRFPAIAASCALLAALAAVTSPDAAAATGRVWTAREASDYNDARMEHVAVSPEGRISLAPALERLAEVPQPFLWCVARDGEGRLFAGGGNDGKVFRVEGERVEVVFDAPEVEVHAIAFDKLDRLYVGSSPDGKVYRVDDGQSEIFFDPGATYIWALAFDDSGNLLVATGQPGRLHLVEPGGESRVLVESRDDHVRSLSPDGRGGFVAGTDGGGIIYTIDPEGRSDVLYDSPEREISALAVSGGHVYAAALSPAQKSRGGSSAQTRGNVTTVRVTAEGGGDEEDSSGGSQPTRQERRQQPRLRFKGAIFRVSREGYARRIWNSDERLPLALLPSGEERVLVGTDGGKILSLGPHGDSSEVASVESEQVSALHRAGDGIYAATSNLGALFKVSQGHAREGTVLGGVRDAGFTSRWGAITWDGVEPPGTEIILEVRTGDTENPDGSWSDWTGPYGKPRGDVIRNEPARFLQWRATLRSRSGTDTPVLRSVQVHYMPENMPPEVESVEVLDPGVWLQPSSPPRGRRGARSQSVGSPKRASGPGMRSVQWTATDENQDFLEADVLFKAEDESVWRLLEASVEGSFVAWDSRAMPDGLYRLRVVVTDAPGNPPGKSLTGFRDSAAFEVDNTPPAVTDVKARLGSRRAEVSATVSDSFSVIGEISYSVDAGEWQLILPEDGLADATSERVRFTTGELEPGEHSIVVKAADRAGNVSAGKVVVRVP